jgi:hypothetical protein
MRCARMARNTLAAVIGIAGLGLGIVRVLPARGAPVKASVAPTYVVLSCSRKPEVKPRRFTSACADNGFGMTNMRWTSWTSHLASGYGTVYENDNHPNHAEGRIYQLSALVVLWGSAPVQGHSGEWTYTHMTAIYLRGRPAIYVKKVNGKFVATYPETQNFPG